MSLDPTDETVAEIRLRASPIGNLTRKRIFDESPRRHCARYSLCMMLQLQLKRTLHHFKCTGFGQARCKLTNVIGQIIIDLILFIYSCKLFVGSHTDHGNWTPIHTNWLTNRPRRRQRSRCSTRDGPGPYSFIYT